MPRTPVRLSSVDWHLMSTWPLWAVEIDSIRHEALRAFVEGGAGAGLNAQTQPKIRDIIAYLHAMASVGELCVPPELERPPTAGRPRGHVEPDGYPQLP